MIYLLCHPETASLMQQRLLRTVVLRLARWPDGQQIIFQYELTLTKESEAWGLPLQRMLALLSLIHI